MIANLWKLIDSNPVVLAELQTTPNSSLLSTSTELEKSPFADDSRTAFRPTRSSQTRSGRFKRHSGSQADSK